MIASPFAYVRLEYSMYTHMSQKMIGGMGYSGVLERTRPLAVAVTQHEQRDAGQQEEGPEDGRGAGHQRIKSPTVVCPRQALPKPDMPQRRIDQLASYSGTDGEHQQQSDRALGNQRGRRGAALLIPARQAREDRVISAQDA